MAGEKRQQQGSGGRSGGEDRSAKRRRYAAAAASAKNKAKSAAGEIRGPGLWISCVRRKEAITTTEAYDLLNDVADRIYPETSTQATKDSSGDVDNHEADEPEDDDIEAQIAKELEELQPTRDPVTGKKKMRFQSARTDTECLVWISCAPPIDPVNLTYTIADELQNGAPVRTRFLQRITPVSNTTHADPNSLKRLAYRILQPIIAPSDYTLDQRIINEPIKYRIEPIIRNHSASLNRQVVTDLIGDVVRDLANPSFQFQRRRNVEGTANVEERNEPPSVEPNMVETSADLAPEEPNSLNEPVSEQILVADPDVGTAMQPEEADNDGAEDQSENLDDSPEETPWHILPEYRRRVFVDLKHPTHTILVSALRGVCGMSVVERYDERKRFNVQVLSGTLHVRENSNKAQPLEDETNMKQEPEGATDTPGDMAQATPSDLPANAAEETVNPEAPTDLLSDPNVA